MMAAWRHPFSCSVMGFPSAVMNRAVGGSESIAVFGAMSAPNHGRSFSRSVSRTGPSRDASVMPGLRGASIAVSVLSIPREHRRGQRCFAPSLRGAQATKQSRLALRRLGCFAEPVIGRRFAPTRWLAMTWQHLPARRPGDRRAPYAVSLVLREAIPPLLSFGGLGDGFRSTPDSPAYGSLLSQGRH